MEAAARRCVFARLALFRLRDRLRRSWPASRSADCGGRGRARRCAFAAHRQRRRSHRALLLLHRRRRAADAGSDLPSPHETNRPPKPPSSCARGTGRSPRISCSIRATSASGKVPARLKPDDTTTMVCGFCSTGCGLNVHLKDGQAINLSADTDYPVNLGMACPKGWEALTPLRAPDRATTPLLRNERRANSSRSIGSARWSLFCERFKEIKAQARPGVGAPFSAPARSSPRRWRSSARSAKFGMGIVHGDGNTRQCMATAHVAYKQSFGFDAPPLHLRGFRGKRRARFRRLESLHRASDHVAARDAQPAPARRSSSSIRARRRPRWPRRSTTPSQPKSDLVLLYGLANILIASGWIDREFIDAHTTGFEEFAEFVTHFTPDVVSAATGLERRANSGASRETIARRKARLVLVDDGRESRPRGHAHRAGDHQSRADDRQHRPARHRREFHHRPVQRDGLAAVSQHHEPARRPRFH